MATPAVIGVTGGVAALAIGSAVKVAGVCRRRWLAKQKKAEAGVTSATPSTAPSAPATQPSSGNASVYELDLAGETVNVASILPRHVRKSIEDVEEVFNHQDVDVSEALKQLWVQTRRSLFHVGLWYTASRNKHVRPDGTDVTRAMHAGLVFEGNATTLRQQLLVPGTVRPVIAVQSVDVALQHLLEWCVSSSEASRSRLTYIADKCNNF